MCAGCATMSVLVKFLSALVEPLMARGHMEESLHL